MSTLETSDVVEERCRCSEQLELGRDERLRTVYSIHPVLSRYSRVQRPRDVTIDHSA